MCEEMPSETDALEDQEKENPKEADIEEEQEQQRQWDEILAALDASREDGEEIIDPGPLWFVCDALDKHTAEHQRALEVVARCQQETARILNNEYQRHVVYPAVRSVGVLADEFFRLRQIAADVKEKVGGCPVLKPLLEAIDIAGKVGEERMSYLDLERIEPALGGELDTANHEVKGAVQTDDKSQHGRIAGVVLPGLVYRGEVLRQAQVLVFKSNGA